MLNMLQWCGCEPYAQETLWEFLVKKKERKRSTVVLFYSQHRSILGNVGGYGILWLHESFFNMKICNIWLL